VPRKARSFFLHLGVLARAKEPVRYRLICPWINMQAFDAHRGSAESWRWRRSVVSIINMFGFEFRLWTKGASK